MAQVFDKSPVEPAHPVLLTLYDDLIAIYRFIRENYQAAIDEKFDEVSRQIGFVVATATPVAVEIGEKGAIKSATLTSKNLQGTLFEGLTKTFKTPKNIPATGGKFVSPGTYNIYLLWYPALKLKFRTEWMEPAHLATHWKEPAHPGVAWKEPAHFGAAWKEPVHAGVGWKEPVHFRPGEIAASIQGELASRYAGRVGGHGEPVHWFDPGYVIAAEEAVLINSIDEVYPELQLANRVAFSRQVARGFVPPEVHEPAHFRQLERALESEKGADIAKEIGAILKKYGY
jgi:hypothetical protein